MDDNEYTVEVDPGVTGTGRSPDCPVMMSTLAGKINGRLSQPKTGIHAVRAQLSSA